MIEVRKREGESTTALLYRFSKRVKQSGVLKESRKRRFLARPMNRKKRLLSALHREEKRREIMEKKKLGTL